MTSPQTSPAAFVTGAGRGIGRSVTESLLEAGWRVAAADIDPAQLADLHDHPSILPVAVRRGRPRLGH